MKKKVLVIEDSNLVRLEVKRILQEHDCIVLESNNAEDLFRLRWQYKDIDLLILDVALPGMDGLTALEYLQADPWWEYLPVIVLTGRADPVTVKRALKGGAVDFISKPFEAQNLWLRVERVLYHSGREEWRSQIDLEHERAKRGNTCYSIVEIRLIDSGSGAGSAQEDWSTRRKLKEVLRNVDGAYITDRGGFILVLPFTAAEGVQKVMRRLGQQIGEIEWEAARWHSVNYPGDGEEAAALVAALRGKFSPERELCRLT